MEDLNFKAPKTKEFVSILDNLKVAGSNVLLVTADNDKNVLLSSRNIAKAKVVTADSLNTYDILNANKVVFAVSSMDKIDNVLN